MESPVDIRIAMARFDNDKEFFRKMLEKFLGYIPEQINALEELVKKGDAKAVEITAHRITGATGMLGAVKASSIALDIENKGRDNDLKDISLLISGLKTEVVNLKKFSSTMQS